jgi:hypothetical protein
VNDGLQNISFDRILMRTKDIISIITSLVSILVMIVGGLWISFKFIETQNQQQQVINSLLQNQLQQQEYAKRR